MTSSILKGYNIAIILFPGYYLNRLCKLLSFPAKMKSQTKGRRNETIEFGIVLTLHLSNISFYELTN